MLTPALGDECIYATGLGPTIEVIGDRDAIRVNFGDWTEQCAISVDPSPRPNLSLGGGWSAASLATCDNWSAQIAFVESPADEGVPIVVFDGKAFYRDCAATGEIDLMGN